MKHFDLDTARRVLASWDGDPGTLAHVATSGNDVYRFRHGDEDRILRLTDTEYRSAEHTRAEMEFLAHLRDRGVRVAGPVLSTAGRLIEVFDGGVAVITTWAPGVLIEPDSRHWNEAFFREWGRCLATIHRAAQSYAGSPRWDWTEEILIREADALFAPDDGPVRREFEAVMELMRSLPKTPANYGMTHADFGPQNFNYDPAIGITAFDFGNCCRHWFVSDIAISLSTLRRHPRRDDYRSWLLDGYRTVFPIDPVVWNHLGDFFRQRIHYVYLSRLKLFGAYPTDDQTATLAMLRGLVLNPYTWPELERA